MDITQLTEVELKALAFDEIQKIEMAKANLNLIAEQLLKVQWQTIVDVKQE